ncbi:glycine--tRNA ligase subunit beta [Marinagarivorans cellulosilyticus]|uniref:Glycine--tRNA ligase beta subunit n=1 Tax=Marinagarivorans cellulosilyticus TaxID=2721545 RepID=A0AAN2BIA7_9GAMM|nr:glycine--tRNA ligase subunit beta [Marinagarivorans cellulosilyticus]BCD95820.1 glycyl-tRNA synthetase beta chain [Marinagarivorans cellulosilyticus]
MSHAFLVELGTEELPPVALKSLSKAFTQSILSGLKAAHITLTSHTPFAAPRRLALLIEGLPATTPLEEITAWGPPTRVAFKDGVPTKAAEAFAKKNGLDVNNLPTGMDGKEEKLMHASQSGGEPTASLMPALVEKALAGLPISKRMRWGASRTEFVRPVHWLAMLWDDTVIPANILDLDAGNTSRGHRFHANRELTLTHATSYAGSLRDGYVMASFEERKALIVEQVKAEGEKLGGVAVISDELLDEVTALNEWPVALAGSFDTEFLQVPAEALVSSMAEHQKYFHVVDASGQLMPNFITIANIESKDPAQVIAGNEKVIRPRLADAAFFFETDKKTPLAERREKLRTVTFQGKLGSVFDKTERIAGLATYMAEQLDFDTSLAKRAGELSKADLVSSMVYEFTDLQGIAGEYYANNDGEPAEVAKAISEQYLPKFAGDALPTTNSGALIALADRIDTIAGIFGLGQTPSGSKDPFGLRRASIAVLRILVEKGYNLDLKALLEKAASQYNAAIDGGLPKGEATAGLALDYMLERFKAWFGEANIPPEVFQAVSAKGLTTPLDIDNRVKAVDAFRQLPEAPALAEANKRVSNILAKNGAPSNTVDAQLLELEPEKTLAAEVAKLAEEVAPLFAKADYTTALKTLARLQKPVDAFFKDVMVMTDDMAVRNNRLALLQQLGNLFGEVADISSLVVK